MDSAIDGERPDLARITTEDELRQAVRWLAWRRRDLTAAVRETGLGRATLWRARSGTGTGLVRLSTLQALARAYDVDHLAEWEEAHQRVQRVQRVRTGRPAVAALTAPVPWELPLDVAPFAGRHEQLGQLDDFVGAGASVVAVSGTAGVGKTGLVVRWAHRQRDRFPDGCLFVDLRGYDHRPPLPPADALARLMRGLGVSEDRIGTGDAASYRSAISDRRMLVVLDNAVDSHQIRELLPGSSACVTIVTSRDALGPLRDRDGARRLDLDLLPLDEAVVLLGELIGERARADSPSTAALAELSARLPLALRLAAGLALDRPSLQIAELVAELTAERRRLLATEFDDGVPLAAVLSWSYRRLAELPARTFRLATLHPGRDLDLHALAALTGVDPDQAATAVGVLTRGHLLQERHRGRFSMHDLLRYWAGRLVGDADSDTDRQAARRRLFDHYLAGAEAAAALLVPLHRDGQPSAAGTIRTAPVHDPEQAQRWLDAERANLVATVLAAGQEAAPQTAPLARALWQFLRQRGRHLEAAQVHDVAAEAAHRRNEPADEAEALAHAVVAYEHLGRYDDAVGRATRALAIRRGLGDRRAEGKALSYLGTAYAYRGNHDEAIRSFTDSIAVAGGTGDKAGFGDASNNLGLLYQWRCRYPQALEHFQQARDVYNQLGDRTRLAIASNNIGLVHLCLGRRREARAELRTALRLGRELSDAKLQAEAAANLGRLYHRFGRYTFAARHLATALSIHRDAGDRSGEAETLDHHASLLRSRGRFVDALDLFARAQEIGKQLNDQLRLASVFNGIAETHGDQDDTAAARSWHTKALAMAERADNPAEQARARDGLARLDRAAHNAVEARLNWQRALALYAEMGAPEAAAVANALRALGTA